jgi:hypothetical protein
MRKIIILIIIASITSCNPFISKDLRKKNRANKRLERLTTKFPSLLSKDTASILYDTIIITPNTKVDTVLSYNFDTVTLYKDKLRLKLIKINDTLMIDAECLPDTIKINTIVKIPFNKISTIKLTLIEQITNTIGKWFWKIILLLAFLVGIRLVYKAII